jgi:histidyl-tRNA synthetase
MSQPPQTLKGFRDFLPEQKRKRDYVQSKITRTFAKYGFAPLQTPTLEYASLLLGKYGTEADKLVYTFKDNGEREVGLRYDQTVPTARVLAQYQHLLPKYFRRYQVQSVFRADKPQKGRFREFTQCDIDVFGSTSSLADAEILACTYAAYKAVGFKTVVLNINDRQVLMGSLSSFATPEVDVFSIIQTIDKLDKISVADGVQELVTKGLDKNAAALAITTIEKAEMSDNLTQIVNNAIALGVPKEALFFNPKIARGLDYYTGMIFEVTVPEYATGSLGAGGRYDNLIEQLGGVSIPAVGMAFGFDRTVEAADELGLIPTDATGTQVLVTIFDGNSSSLTTSALAAAALLRQKGVAVEVYPGSEKLGKQFKYADQQGIPYVLIIGEDEAAQDMVTLKEMKSGEQTTLRLEEAVNKLGV